MLRLAEFLRFSTIVSKLRSNQEESEVYLVLHTKHERDGGIQYVLVVCEDKDIMAVLLAHVDLINDQLFQKVKLKTPKEF